MLALVEKLNTILPSNPEESIVSLVNEIGEGICFSTSLGWEDQVLSHIIFVQNLDIEVFTLDTGRLFNETYSVLNSTIGRYNKHVKVYYPEAISLEAYVNAKGVNGFYESAESRKECCNIRKVQPLKRALKGKKVWITGLRAEQSGTRNNMEMVEFDELNNIIKFHPLLHWTLDEVKKYIKKHNIPYNPLHDKGFVSIGCAPCTRAINPGDDFRAGRWWWENNSKKECGLHQHK